MTKILLITHTDPRGDARILKALEVSVNLDNESLALGISRLENVEEHARVTAFKIPDRLRIISNKININRFRFIRIFLGVYRYSVIIFKFTRAGIRFKPEVLHCNDWVVLPAAIITKFFTRSRLIYDAHELESETQNLPKHIKSYVKFLESTFWFYIDHLISVSPSIIQWYKVNYGFKESSLILNSPSMEKYKKDFRYFAPNYFIDKYQLKDSTKIYLHIGNLVAGRNIQEIINAFNLVDSESVVIFIGSGYMDEIIKSNVMYGKRIFLHSPVPNKHLIELAMQCDIGLCLIETVSLSDTYSLPNKLFEYAFANLYVLASDLPDIRSIVVEYNLGSFIDTNETRLATWIDHVGTQISKNRLTQGVDLHKLSWNFQKMILSRVYLTLAKS